MKVVKILGIAIVLIVAAVFGGANYIQKKVLDKVMAERDQVVKEQLPEEREAASAVFDRLQARGLTSADMTELDSKRRKVNSEMQDCVNRGVRFPVELYREDLAVYQSIADHPKGEPYPDAN